MLWACEIRDAGSISGLSLIINMLELGDLFHPYYWPFLTHPCAKAARMHSVHRSGNPYMPSSHLISTTAHAL